MTPGDWSDVTTQGQFLLELEFLTRYVPLPEEECEGICVYTRCPPYLKLIACQFPWIHFYAFRCDAAAGAEEEATEYDPDEPAIRWTSRATLQTERNRTTSPFEFSKDSAVMLSRKEQRKVLMICHGETETRQVALHALLRADHSLLDVGGTIPADYLEGDLVLPILLPPSKVFACLVASQPCRCVGYDRGVYEQEMGFFQGTLRGTEAFDCASKGLIVGDYVRRFQHCYPGAHPDGVRVSLEAIVDSLGVFKI
jgi:hypothetical protein